MRKLLRLVAGVLLGGSTFAGPPALAQTANQQDMGTMMVAETLISVGGGLAYLTLPDTRFTFRYQRQRRHDQQAEERRLRRVWRRLQRLGGDASRLGA
jgi:hypothetical protein